MYSYFLIIGLAFIFILLLVYFLYFKNYKSLPSFYNIKNSTHLILTSAQCKPYQDWQSFVLYYSAQKIWPEANIKRLLACDKKDRYENIMPSFITTDYQYHPISGDEYLPYNRPASIKEFFDLTDPTEQTIIVIDPDVILLKKLDFTPLPGRPIAQLYDYMNNDNALQKITKKLAPDLIDKVQPVGMPMILDKNDLKQVSKKWLYYTELIRNDPECKNWAGWIAEMHSYALASADVGLTHIITDDLADRSPYNKTDPFLLHYDLPHSSKNFSWNKRDYMNDILDNYKLMQIPSSGTENYKKVFIEINNGLNHFKNIYKNDL